MRQELERRKQEDEWKRQLEDAKRSMSSGIGRRRQSIRYPAAMLAMMELMVLSQARAPFLRAFAWFKLVKIWAA